MPAPTRRSAKPPAPPKVLETYGLAALGYDGFDTGNYLEDQLLVEATCFRIGLRPDEGGLGKFGHFKRYVDLLWNNPDLGSTKKAVWNPWTDRMLEEACYENMLSCAGCASAGKSSPFALWGVANYVMDPTHVKVFMASTTIKLAKERIWKEAREFWGAIQNLPGKLLDSTNEIKGLSYDKKGYGDSSGIRLIATEKSAEANALEALIGLKAPRTGAPDESFEALMNHIDFVDLADKHCEEYLRELLPRLMNLMDERMGKIILIIDEATGCAQGVLNAILSNMRPGNEGRLQVIMIGNPASHFDVHGQFSEPVNGWDSVTLQDESWETKIGGKCIRFNAEKSPRIVEKNEKCSWMLSADAIKQMAKDFGKESLYYYRMCLGHWFPLGMEAGVYSEADFLSTGAMERTHWGFEPPKKISTLDHGFSIGGDRSSCTFFTYGKDPSGLTVLQREENITIMADANNTTVPVPYQIARNWRDECRKRGIPPENAAFDATGGGITFAAIVKVEWSPLVHAISSGGKASKDPLENEKTPDGKKVTAAEKFANKATEIWYGAHAFLRTRQLKGVTAELAKEICSRQHDKSGSPDGRTLKIENKRIFKAREKSSPDDSDSWFLGIEHVKRRHGFRPASGVSVDAEPVSKGSTSWEHFRQKARRITKARSLTKR